MADYWVCSSGRIELDLSLDDAHTGYHQGACDQDIDYLSTIPRIKDQLSKLDPEIVKDELRGYGAWDDNELSDHDQNLKRLLWLACGDLVEDRFSDDEETD
jgi:hypothetical protein